MNAAKLPRVGRPNSHETAQGETAHEMCEIQMHYGIGHFYPISAHAHTHQVIWLGRSSRLTKVYCNYHEDKAIAAGFCVWFQKYILLKYIYVYIIFFKSMLIGPCTKSCRTARGPDPLGMLYYANY